MQSAKVMLDESLLRFLHPALLRLSYTDPQITVEMADAGLTVSCPLEMALDTARQKLKHALYREKILTDTMPLRVGLLNLLSAR